MLLKNPQRSFIEELLITTSSLGINYEYEGVIGNHLKDLIEFFSQRYNLNQDLLIQGINPNFLNNKKFDENHWFVNEVQFEIYRNIQKNLKKQGIQKEEFLKQCYLFGRETRKKLTGENLKEIIKLTGTSMDNIISFPEEFSTQNTLFRRLNITSKKLNSNLKEYEISISSLPGLKTPLAVANYWNGELDEILEISEDRIIPYHIDDRFNFSSLKFDYKTGSFIKKVKIAKSSNSTNFPIRRDLIKFLHPNLIYRNLKSQKKFEELESTLNSASEWVFSKRDELTRRHENTGYHVSKVTFYTNLAMFSLGFKADQLRNGVLASLLHDKGKEAIIDKILLKKGAFSPLERIIMDDHGPLGTAMILQETLGMYKKGEKEEVFEDLLGEEQGRYTFLNNVADIARGTYEHHEDCKGEGFLFQKLPNEISLIGRILQFTDIFDAMLENRPYKKGLSLDESIQFMRKLPKGTLDSNIILLFENHIIPVLRENFGEENISENVNLFLEKRENHFNELRDKILGLNNYSLELEEEFPFLVAPKNLRNWSKNYKFKKMCVNDLVEDNNRYFSRHFLTLDLVSRIENLIITQENSFSLEIPDELNQLIYKIDGRKRFPFRSIQNLSPDSIKFLQKNSNLTPYQHELIEETKEKYLNFVPYLEKAMFKTD